ncbi:MAG: hypothetical protein JSS27_05520 [Planctomycetes bacterium]|nr:hypothetical protein [Planctomycetota bacterium]
MSLWPQITDRVQEADRLRGWRAGSIEIERGEFRGVRWRPWARRPTRFEAVTVGEAIHRWRRGDRCRLYWHQPGACPEFLALDYVQSSHQTSFATFRRALVILDEIAVLKQSWGIVCDVSNLRISARLLRRWGWEAHAPMSYRRNYIKRFAWPEPARESDQVTAFRAALAAEAAGATC